MVSIADHSELVGWESWTIEGATTAEQWNLLPCASTCLRLREVILWTRMDSEDDRLVEDCAVGGS